MNKKEEIESYFSSENINQTHLKKVLGISKPVDPNASDVMAGSYVDCVLTTPELFEETFYVFNGNIPVPTLKSPIERVVASGKWSDMQDAKDVLIHEYRQQSDKRIGDDKLFDNFLECSGYWNELMKANGRKIVSIEQQMQWDAVANSLRNNPNTSKHFIKEDLTFYHIFQKAVFFEYVPIGLDTVYQCKALFDILHVDLLNRTLRVKDIKCTESHTGSWKRNVANTLRYDIQLAWYFEAVDWLIQNDPAFHGYTQLMPMLIVESVKHPGRPRVFELTPDDLFIGKHGCEVYNGMILLEEDDIEAQRGLERHYRKPGFNEAFHIMERSKKLGIPFYDLEYVETYSNSDYEYLNIFQ